MICITHTTPGRSLPDGWILARDLAEAAERADDGGQGALALTLRKMSKPARGPSSLGTGWTMIAGERAR